MTSVIKDLHLRYNALTSIETAYERLQACDGHEAALAAAGQLLIDAGLEQDFAVRLLHKHNDISAGDVMVEGFERLRDGTPAMSTVRTPVSDTRPRGVSVWDCGPDGQVVPLEFTVECGDVAGHDQLLARREALFASFNALMRRHGLEGILGLCTISRRLQPGDGEILVETIDSRRDANVVVLERDVDLSSGALVPTTWAFDGDVTMGCKKQYCMKFCRIDQLTQCHKQSGHEGIHVGT